MIKIEPKYVTFEQAKLLKEKGFEDIQIDYGLNQMLNNCKAPEQWQIVEWLRNNHGIWVSVDFNPENSLFFYCIRRRLYRVRLNQTVSYHNEPHEAYSAAFDYILNNNLI